MIFTESNTIEQMSLDASTQARRLASVRAALEHETIGVRTMTLSELQAQVALGEDSRRQFKQDMQSPDALAAEMAAFANSEGGVIFLGVADDGSLPGLSLADVSRLNQMISNVAAQHVRSPLTVQTENVDLENGRLVIALTVPRGIDKPYFDRNGVIWLKSAADKRRVNSKEELRRLFQSADQFHADELPTKAGIESLTGCGFGIFCAMCTSRNSRMRHRIGCSSCRI